MGQKVTTTIYACLAFLHKEINHFFFWQLKGEEGEYLVCLASWPPAARVGRSSPLCCRWHTEAGNRHGEVAPRMWRSMFPPMQKTGMMHCVTGGSILMAWWKPCTDIHGSSQRVFTLCIDNLKGVKQKKNFLGAVLFTFSWSYFQRASKQVASLDLSEIANI